MSSGLADWKPCCSEPRLQRANAVGIAGLLAAASAPEALAWGAYHGGFGGASYHDAFGGAVTTAPIIVGQLSSPSDIRAPALQPV